MRLKDILNEQDFRGLLEGMLEPPERPPDREKGPDAIKVQGYFVHGHWRRRTRPQRRLLRVVAGRKS